MFTTVNTCFGLTKYLILSDPANLPIIEGALPDTLGLEK